MKCLKCGAELSEDTKFCSYCGAKVEAQTEIPPIPPEVEEADEPKTEEKYTYQNNTVYNAPVASKPASNADKIKTKFLSVWSKLSKFGKIAAIGITVFVILGLVAFLAGRIFAGILAVAQIAIVVVAILMKKQIIKVPKTWIPLVAIILSFVLIVPYFCLFKVNMADYEKYAWNEVVLANMLPMYFGMTAKYDIHFQRLRRKIFLLPQPNFLPSVNYLLFETPYHIFHLPITKKAFFLKFESALSILPTPKQYR